jgi:D-3-phosphoglycerate dehydrogenase
LLILIADKFDDVLPEKLKRFGEVTSDIARLAEADVVLVRAATKADKAFFEKATKCKLIIRGGVGTDNIDKAAAKEKGVEVLNTPKASSVAVAELTFAMMLAVPNRLIEAHNGMLEGKFLKKELKRTELFEKTLGLVGIGRISQEVARRAAAFGMKVLAYDPFVTSSPVAKMVPTLDELVAAADYLSLHTPLTDQTRGMINAAVIAKMKKGAVVVNAGRGACVVAEDLKAALDSGQLAGYATDVWPSDPPPPDYPLLKHPKVLMVPHLGASTKENLLRIGAEVEEILAQRQGGK